MGNFLQKQGLYLLTNRSYAYLLTALLAVIPFASWLSLSVIALVTLRKGSYEGFKILITGLLLAVLMSSQSSVIPFELPTILATYGLTYISALALRAALDLKMLVAAIAALSILIIILVHGLWPELIIQQLDVLIGLFQKVLPEGQMLQVVLADKLNKTVLANYLLGIQVLSIVISALSSLMMARYVQSLLFYPGGLRQELLSFKAAKVFVLGLLLTSIGVYYHYPLAISCLPILLVYVMSAGILVLFKLIAKKKDWLTMLFLFVPLIIAPYVMLPIYVLFGSLDSWFNITRQLSKTGDKKNS